MITSTRILTTTNVNPHINLATEDALLTNLPAGQALLFLWQNKHTIVIGAGQNAWRECHTTLLEQDKGTLARRSSGGGAVYHDMGNLNFSFIMPKEDYDVARQLHVVLKALKTLGIDAQPSGRNDLTASGRKFSGNAFRLLKTSALHHGTLIVNVDMPNLGKYLNVAPDKLKAKGVKSVPARVVNLSELAPVTIAQVHDALIAAFIQEYGNAPVESLEDITIDGLPELIEKYSSWDWNYGRSPSGEINLRERFDWGVVEINASVQSGALKDVVVYSDAMDETLHERLRCVLENCPWRGNDLSERTLPINEDVAKWLERV